MRFLLWLVLFTNQHDGKEATDRLVPAGWEGNPWGPVAAANRASGAWPAVEFTPSMKQWDEWGKKNLQTGDLIFRLGDARILRGWFKFSRFIANISGSAFSHVGTVVIEDGQVMVYDMTQSGCRKQPLSIFVLDNVGAFGVKRLKPEHRQQIPKVIAYLQNAYQKQVPFDYELSGDDRAFYCVELAEKAFRAGGLTLSQPVKLADMENIQRFPLPVLGFTSLTSLTLDQEVFFPGNDRHGIWSCPMLETIYDSRVHNTQTAAKAKDVK